MHLSATDAGAILPCRLGIRLGLFLPGSPTSTAEPAKSAVEKLKKKNSAVSAFSAVTQVFARICPVMERNLSHGFDQVGQLGPIVNECFGGYPCQVELGEPVNVGGGIGIHIEHIIVITHQRPGIIQQ